MKPPPLPKQPQPTLPKDRTNCDGVDAVFEAFGIIHRLDAMDDRLDAMDDRHDAMEGQVSRARAESRQTDVTLGAFQNRMARDEQSIIALRRRVNVLESIVFRLSEKVER